MTEEEFKKAMTKTIIFIVTMIIILIVVAVLVFNKSGKSTSIFKNDAEKVNYNKAIEEMNSPKITNEDAEKISGSEETIHEDGVENSNPENQPEENSPSQENKEGQATEGEN